MKLLKCAKKLDYLKNLTIQHVDVCSTLKKELVEIHVVFF
jgi:hypothetical protein